MVWERIEVSRSLIFAVGNESAKTAKIKRLENLGLALASRGCALPVHVPFNYCC